MQNTVCNTAWKERNRVGCYFRHFARALGRCFRPNVVVKYFVLLCQFYIQQGLDLQLKPAGWTMKPHLMDPDLVQKQEPTPGPQAVPAPVALEGQVVRNGHLAYQPNECLEAIRAERFMHMLLESLTVQDIRKAALPPLCRWFMHL